MARKPNYDQDKRRKEMDRKARKDAKLAERQQRRDQQGEDEAAQEAPSPGDGPPQESSL